MKKILLLLIASNLSFASFSQITKNNWLAGGNGTFIYQKFKTEVDQKIQDLILSPNVGYFFVDKFAAGLKLNFEHYKSKNAFSEASANIYKVGPFFRYYFLPGENGYNILFEGGYQYALTNTNVTTLKQNTFSVCGGPVLFLNSVIGVEFLLGYSTSSYVNDKNKENAFRIAIGLQIHLERDDQ